MEVGGNEWREGEELDVKLKWRRETTCSLLRPLEQIFACRKALYLLLTRSLPSFSLQNAATSDENMSFVGVDAIVVLVGDPDEDGVYKKSTALQVSRYSYSSY